MEKKSMCLSVEQILFWDSHDVVLSRNALGFNYTLTLAGTVFSCSMSDRLGYVWSVRDWKDIEHMEA